MRVGWLGGKHRSLRWGSGTSLQPSCHLALTEKRGAEGRPKHPESPIVLGPSAAALPALSVLIGLNIPGLKATVQGPSKTGAELCQYSQGEIPKFLQGRRPLAHSHGHFGGLCELTALSLEESSAGAGTDPESTRLHPLGSVLRKGNGHRLVPGLPEDPVLSTQNQSIDRTCACILESPGFLQAPPLGSSQSAWCSVSG